MNWINIHTDTLRSEAYLGADPVERATWLNLLAWCCAQENGGLIEGCRDWKDRMWQQLCGVTKSEVETECELFTFEGDNLRVAFYPEEMEQKVKTNRKNGSKGGRPKKEPPQPVENEGEKPCGFDSLNQVDTIRLNEKKRKGKEKIRKGEATREREAPPGQDQFANFKTKINQLRPEWQSPAAWSYAEEQHLFNGAATQMAELGDDDWQTLEKYFAAYLDQAKAYWRPNSRSKFVESFADVWAGCQRWRGKSGNLKTTNNNQLF
jgi:uncharacterized protein YukE